jgi:hypothetical protein
MLSQDYAFTSVSDTNVPSNIATAGSQFSDSVDNQSANATDANGITVVTTSTTDAE